jgi:putative FmdB family regulatory protein
MPLYDYDCSACGRRFEVVHGVHADPPTACPICGKGPIRKAIAAPAVHFKGTGWAKRDRRATSTPGTSKASGEGGSSDGGAKDGGAKDGGAKDGGTRDGESSSSSGASAATATKPAETGTSSKAD